MRRRTFVRVGAAVLALGISMPALTAGAFAQDAPVEITMLTLGNKPTNGRLEAMLDKLNPLLIEKANAKLDLFYVENWSITLDLLILLGTAEHLIVRLVASLRRKPTATEAPAASSGPVTESAA